MTMTIDNQQRHHLSSMGLDHMPYVSAGPQFSNPWAASSAPSSSQLYPSSFGSYAAVKSEPARDTTSMSMPYSSMPATSGVTSNYSASSYNQQALLNPSPDLRQSYDHTYSSAPSQQSYPAQTTSFPPITSYGQQLAHHSHQEQSRAQAPYVPLS